MPNGDKVWVEAEQDEYGGGVVLTLVDVGLRRRVYQQHGSHNVHTALHALKNFPPQFAQKLQQGYPVRFKMFQHAFEAMLTGQRLTRQGEKQEAFFEEEPLAGSDEVPANEGFPGIDDDLENEPPTQDDLNNNAVIQEVRGGYVVVIDQKLISFTQKVQRRPFEPFEHRTIDKFDNHHDAFKAVKGWMNDHKYWPTLYYVNERGNIELMDIRTGKFIRGWV